MENSNRERILGVMLGHAVADALGVPVEFRRREELCRAPVTGMRGFGTYPVPAGSWSDDTSMALAALDSLAGGTVDLDDVMERFGAWCYRDEYTPTGKLFDIGGTCRRAIDNYCRRHMSVTECGLRDDYSNGNGSLMRIHPFVLYAHVRGLSLPERMALIDAASALTHAHERSKIGCGIYSFVLSRLLVRQERGEITAALRDAAAYYGDAPELCHYAALFEELALRGRETICGDGYVVHSLEAALFCLLTTDSYRDCVLSAVNLGEDTDTTAAIAGSLAGALYGYRAIPGEWLAVLGRRAYIEAMCERAAVAWEGA